MARRPSAETGERGSIVLLALFVCLGVAALVQALGTVALVAQRAAATEDSGRCALGLETQGLAALGRMLLADGEWSAAEWSPIPGVEGAEGRMTGLPDSEGWVMAVAARVDSALSLVESSAWIERGRDGLDLPVAALVADQVETALGRESAWLRAGDDAAPAPAVAYVHAGVDVGVIPDGVEVRRRDAPWRLDDGWLALLGAASPGEGVGWGSRVTVMQAPPGRTVPLPAGWGEEADAPDLVVLTGGGSLDARGRGDIAGVIVLDGGDLLLDGTALFGAACASGVVHMGASGCVIYSAETLRWATDRSLVRTRVVPGSHTESVGG